MFQFFRTKICQFPLIMSLKLLLLLMFLFSLFNLTIGLAVMSIDLGSESIKIAIVSPGKPMEVILNVDSQRKTPLAVGFRDGDRFFGEAAMSTNSRFPEKVFTHILDLIGKPFNSSLVKLFKKRFPHYHLTEDLQRSTVLLHHPDGMIYSPEELLAMVLEKAKYYAELATGDKQKIKEAVLTVPSYFNQAERKSIIKSAQLAGLKVLQLINVNTAVALNYGVFRRKDFNENITSYVLFYEMGSSATVATVVAYQSIKNKEKGFTESIPQLIIKGVGFDRTLGGLEMQMRLRDYLAKLFSEQSKIRLNLVLSNHKAMSKLFKEAGRLKKILSANTEHFVQIENVMNDLDLKVMVKRLEFEKLCSNILNENVVQPVLDAIQNAEVDLSQIDNIILFGGNTRVPKLQQVLLEFLKVKDLAKNINADEAAALGAAYQAAYLSKAFKVKKFVIKDANLYPIQVDFSREIEQEDGNKKLKSVQKILFSKNNFYPQKKVLTLTRHKSNFDFYINYSNLSNFFNSKIVEQIGSLNISKVSFKNISQCLAAHSHPNKEYKSIKVHFQMNESGILSLDQVDAIFEAKVEEKIENNDAGSNTVGQAFAKFGNTISKLFGKLSESESNKTSFNEVLSNNQTSSNNMHNLSETFLPGYKTNEINETEKSQPKIEIKIKILKEPLDVDIKDLDLLSLSETKYNEWVKNLKNLNVKEEEKHNRDKVKNALESFIHESKMRLYDSEFEAASTEEERTNILKKLNSESEWFEYDSDNAETSIFKDKLSFLKSIMKEVTERIQEHRERPEAIKALDDMLNLTRNFFLGAKNITSTDQVFTQVELDTLEALINNTQAWLNNAVLEQQQVPLYLTPKLLVKTIKEKFSFLDREIKYLINKARLNPPKKKPNEAAVEKVAEKEDKIEDNINNVEEPNVKSFELNDSYDKHSQSLPSKTIDQIHTEL